MSSKIVLAILGHGTCGKTTASRWFASNTDLCYKYSTSEYAKQIIELPGDHTDRSQHRIAWSQAIADFNNQDGGIKLYKLLAEKASGRHGGSGRVVGGHDIFDGIRRVNELTGVKWWVRSQDKLFIPIWIDRDVPEDPSCEIRPEHCTFAVNNRKTLHDFYDNLFLLWKGLSHFNETSR